MKKALLLAAGILVASFAQAQDYKMWLSGTASYSSSNTDPGDLKVSGGSFGPAWGMMINENIAVGLGLNITGSTTDAGTELKSSGFEVMPFMRYYKAVSDNFSLYGELNISFGSGKQEILDTDINGLPIIVDADFSTLDILVGPGVQYWFTDRWSMNAQVGVLGYSSRTDKDAALDSNGSVTDLKTNSFGLALDFTSLNFALNYHF